MSEFDDLYNDSETTPVNDKNPSEFDQLFEAVSPTNKIRGNLLDADGVNPDDFVERQRLSKELRTPEALLPPTAEAQAELLRKQNNPEELAAKSPSLAKWLETTRNAKLIGGDARSLRSLESTARRATPGKPILSGLGTSFAEGLKRTSAAVKVGAIDVTTPDQFEGKTALEFSADLARLKEKTAFQKGETEVRFDTMSNTWKEYDRKTGLPANLESNMLTAQAAEKVKGTSFEDYRKKIAPHVAAYIAAQRAISETTPEFDTTTGEVLYGAASGAMASLPALAATLATRGAAGPIVFGIPTAAEQSLDVKLRGGTPREAQLAALTTGAATTVLNAVPAERILGLLGKKGVDAPGFLKQAFLAEAPFEVADTTVQAVVDTAIANPDKTWGDLMAELPKQWAIAITGAVITAGALEVPHAGIKAFNDRAQKAQQRAADHDVLTTASAQAASEPLRKRDPAAFHEFVNNMSDDGGTIAEVYVSAEELTTLLKTPGNEDIVAKIPDLQEQLTEATPLKGDVRIPFADYLTHIAGTELDAALLPKLKTSVDGATYEESQAFFQSAVDTMHTEMDQVLSESEPVLTRQEFEAQVAQERPKPAERRVAPRRTAGENNAPVLSKEYGEALQFAEKTRQESKALRERGPERRTTERRVDTRARDTLQKAQASGEYTEEQVQKLLEMSRSQPNDIKEKLGAARVRMAVATPEQLPAAQAEVASLEKQLAQRSEQVESALKQTPEQKAKKPKKGKKLPKTYEEYLASHPSRKAVIQDSKDKVEEQIVNQFVNSGRYSREVARLNSMAITEFYATQAARMGILPAELYARYPLKVTPDTIPGYAQEELDFSNLAVARDAVVDALEAAGVYASVETAETGSSYLDLFFGSKEEVGTTETSLGMKVRVSDHPGRDGAYSVRVDLGDVPAQIAEIIKAAEAKIKSKLRPLAEVVAHVNNGGRQELDADTIQEAAGGAERFRLREVFLEDIQQDVKPADTKAVAAFAKRETQAPAIVLGAQNNIIDGRHRVAAALARGETTIKAYVPVKGTKVSEDIDSWFKQGNRGSFDPATLTMSFLNSADLSTPLHESGHAYLELLAHIARAADAPPAIVDDVIKVLNWFGVKDLAEWEAMTVEQKRPHHEQWAESYERYLFENTAPSPDLRPIFARFSVWLTRVYKSLADFLKSHPAAGKLNDEIRGVFDRMLASADAIATAEELRGYEAIFSVKQASNSEILVVQNDEATVSAISKMRQRSLRDMQWLSGAKSKALKELQKTADAKRAVIREEVAREVANEPIEKVRAALLSKELNAIKINTVVLKEMFPGIDVGLLRGMTHAEFGYHPDVIADMYGFGSGVELITTLIDEESTASKIEGLTDKRMLEENGELVDPQSIEHAANLAVHNEARAKFLATGLTVLTGSPIPASQLARAAKVTAQRVIDAKKIRDIRPAQYEVAESKANKEILSKAASKPADAIAAQRAALLNNRLARASVDALSEVEKGIAHARKLVKKAAQDNMRGEFLTQLNALLDRFDIRTSRTLTQIDADKTPLAEWLNSESDRLSAVVPDVPIWVLNEATRKHYKDMTVEEFRGLMDAVKGLELLARRKEKQYQAIRNMKFSEERKAVLARIREFNPQVFKGDEPLPTSDEFVPSLANAVKTLGEKGAAEFLNPETIVNIIEGGQFGQLHESLLGRLDAGVNRKATRLAAITKQMTPLLKAYSLKEKYDFSRKDIGAIGGKRITRENAVVIALLHGSQDGRDRLQNHGWSEAQQKEVLLKLDDKDFDLVEGIWKLFDQDLWPELKALNERTRGKAPPKVAPVPYTIGKRTLTGGYFKLKYISKGSAKATRLEKLESAKELLGGGFGATAKTKQGSSTERIEKTDMRPRLDLGTFVEAVHETVHDIELREAVADTARLLKDKGIVAAITNTAGEAGWRALEQKLEDTAARPVNPTGFLEKFSTVARKNTVVTLMSGLGTAIQNVTGFFSALDRVSLGRLALEVARTTPGVFKKRYEFALSQSEYLRNRYSSYDRDLQSAASKLQLKAEILPDTATLLWFMGQVDKRVSVSVWNTAFADGMKKFRNDIAKSVAYADHIVRQTQGSGRDIDLSRIASRGPLHQIFTMFYSYFNSQLAMLVRSGAVNKKLAKEHPVLAAALFTKTFLLVFAIPAILTRAIFAGNQPEDEDEDWVHKYGIAMLKYGMGMIPILRDVGTYALAKVDPSTPDYGMKLSPVQSALEGVVNAPIAIADIVTGDGTDQDTKNALMGVSYAVGLPGNLIKNTYTGVEAWLEGEGTITDLIYGKRKE